MELLFIFLYYVKELNDTNEIYALKKMWDKLKTYIMCGGMQVEFNSDGMRYYSFTQYCRNNFGRKLYKVPLNAHLSCPNRDGKIGTRGCIFCSAGGSGEFAIDYDGGQLKEENLIYSHISAPGSYIGYFQAFTNTYAPVEYLRKIYTGILRNPLFAGISIATRPDCVDFYVISLLSELKQEFPDKFIWVELGLQTMHEKTAVYIRRGYGLDVFENCVRNLHGIDVPVIVHVIIGLPGEDEHMNIETAEYLSILNIEGIKIQLLNILKGTDLYDEYMEGKFSAMTLEAYVKTVAEMLSVTSPETVIHRLTGDGDKNLLAAPLWSRDKKHVINCINHMMKEMNIKQGDKI